MRSVSSHRKVSIATGVLAYPLLCKLAGKAQELFPGLTVEDHRIVNDYFGHNITVAGLITGTDLMAQLKGKDLGEALLIPNVMLRHEQDMFLDDVTLEEAQAAFGHPDTGCGKRRLFGAVRHDRTGDLTSLVFPHPHGEKWKTRRENPGKRRHDTMAKPIIAVVGRPNVGKSTLFNKLIGQRLSIVQDTPGVTRARIYAPCEWRNEGVMLVDTGGIEPRRTM